MSVYLKEDFIPANVSIGSGLLDRKRAGYEGRGGASLTLAKNLRTRWEGDWFFFGSGHTI